VPWEENAQAKVKAIAPALADQFFQVIDMGEYEYSAFISLSHCCLNADKLRPSSCESDVWKDGIGEPWTSRSEAPMLDCILAVTSSRPTQVTGRRSRKKKRKRDEWRSWCQGAKAEGLLPACSFHFRVLYPRLSVHAPKLLVLALGSQSTLFICGWINVFAETKVGVDNFGSARFTLENEVVSVRVCLRTTR
jgi:hypothetical protein